MRRRAALLAVLLLLPAGPAASQAPVAGRWHLRLATGTTTVRGELVLQQQGTALTGTLVLETSPDPPEPLREGHLSPAGTFEFVVDNGEPLRFSGALIRDSLAGEVSPAPGLRWHWSATRLAPGAEFYAALPTFRSAQLALGRERDAALIPARWVDAARVGAPLAVRAESLARAARLPAIPADSLRAAAVLAGLGLWQREAMLPALLGALASIRERLAPADRARFDALFRPRGAWLVDLHDAALDAARRARPVTWADALPALEAAGLVPPDQPPGTALVPLACYRATMLQQRDSAGYAALRQQLARTSGPSPRAAEALLDGYLRASGWPGQAVSFLLGAAWVPTPGGPASPAALIAHQWGRDQLDIPALRPRFFGYPEAVPRVAVPGGVVPRLLTPDNWSGRAWLERRGAPALLDVFRRLDPAVAPNAVLAIDGDWTLTTPAREAASTPSGFLETRDEILVDPGIPPVFALATAVHEWQHLLMTRTRLLEPVGGMLRPEGQGLRVVPPDPFLAEGFAEWSTAVLLEGAEAAVPALGVGEARKLALLEGDDPDDTHVLGFRMMRALAAALGSPDAARNAVLASADNPIAVAGSVSAWSPAGAAPVEFPVRAARRLIPETEFTIEDGVGDVTGILIRSPRP